MKFIHKKDKKMTKSRALYIETQNIEHFKSACEKWHIGYTAKEVGVGQTLVYFERKPSTECAF